MNKIFNTFWIDINMDLTHFTKFQRRVYEVTEKIPKGKVSTYGQIAEILGNKNYARAVGNALNKNPYPVIIPCHRVVKSDGTIGGFAHGTQKKIQMLKSENIKIINERIDLSKYLVSSKILSIN
jgi:methylated-DNA-[protein]-cysteine S-methyltransferase